MGNSDNSATLDEPLVRMKPGLEVGATFETSDHHGVGSERSGGRLEGV